MSLARKFRIARERPIGFAPEHPHDIKLRIDEPVLPNACALEEPTLDLLVSVPSPRRENLDDQGRGALHVLVGQNVRLIDGNEQQIRFDDIPPREDDIERRDKDSPKTRALPQKQLNREMETANQHLMTRIRAGS
jgi:hypothetical protein